MKVIYDGEGEDITNGEASGEVTVGVGVNKNDFGVKVIDDGQGEDVTNGEGVNVKDLGDGEADIGDDDEGSAKIRDSSFLLRFWTESDRNR